jgi:hypothetical protein
VSGRSDKKSRWIFARLDFVLLLGWDHRKRVRAMVRCHRKTADRAIAAMGICDGQPADILCRSATILIWPSIFLNRKSLQAQIQNSLSTIQLEILNLFVFFFSSLLFIRMNTIMPQQFHINMNGSEFKAALLLCSDPHSNPIRIADRWEIKYSIQGATDVNGGYLTALSHFKSKKDKFSPAVRSPVVPGRPSFAAG